MCYYAPTKPNLESICKELNLEEFSYSISESQLHEINYFIDMMEKMNSYSMADNRLSWRCIIADILKFAICLDNDINKNYYLDQDAPLSFSFPSNLVGRYPPIEHEVRQPDQAIRRYSSMREVVIPITQEGSNELLLDNAVARNFDQMFTLAVLENHEFVYGIITKLTAWRFAKVDNKSNKVFYMSDDLRFCKFTWDNFLRFDKDKFLIFVMKLLGLLQLLKHMD